MSLGKTSKLLLVLILVLVAAAGWYYRARLAQLYVQMKQHFTQDKSHDKPVHKTGSNKMTTPAQKSAQKADTSSATKSSSASERTAPANRTAAHSPGKQPFSGMMPDQQSLRTIQLMLLNKQQWMALQALQQARSSAWQGHLDEAIKHYQRTLALSPHNIDAMGELGNVYYRQGKKREAARTYARLVRHLFEYGRYQQGAYLIHVIARLHPETAQQLVRGESKPGKQ